MKLSGSRRTIRHAKRKLTRAADELLTNEYKRENAAKSVESSQATTDCNDLSANPARHQVLVQPKTDEGRAKAPVSPSSPFAPKKNSLPKELLDAATSITQRFNLPAMVAQRRLIHMLRSFEQERHIILPMTKEALVGHLVALEESQEPMKQVVALAKSVTEIGSHTFSVKFLWQDKAFAFVSQGHKTEGEAKQIQPPQARHLGTGESIDAWGVNVKHEMRQEISRLKHHVHLLNIAHEKWGAMRKILRKALPNLVPQDLASLPGVRAYAVALAKDLKQVDSDIAHVEQGMHPWQEVIHYLRPDGFDEKKADRVFDALILHFHRFGLVKEAKELSEKNLQTYARYLAHAILSERFASVDPKKSIEVLLYTSFYNFWTQPTQQELLGDDLKLIASMCRALSGCALVKPVEFDNPMYPRQRLVLTDIHGVVWFSILAKMQQNDLDEFLKKVLFKARETTATTLQLMSGRQPKGTNT